MDPRSRALVVLTLATLLALPLLSGQPGCTSAPERMAPLPPGWVKGNTHTHSLWSDGDAAPEKIARWYKDHGYQFLVLSDHNILLQGEKWVKIGTHKKEATPEHVAELQAAFGMAAVELRERGGVREMKLKTLAELRKTFEEPDRFLFIHGEEITDRFIDRSQGAPVEKPIHHGAVNHVGLIPPCGGTSVRDVLERTMVAVEAEAKSCGKPVLVHLNHPNFGWGITPDDVASVTAERFFEVYNGHRDVRNYGDRTHPSTEQLWDYVLSMRLGKLGGPPLYALATDDAHNYHKDQGVSNPGRGWVVVRSPALDADTITRAMLRGDFYASTGVVLEAIEPTETSLAIRIAALPGVHYVTRFIGMKRGGAPGVVLQETPGASASYPFAGDELYVRATIVSDEPHPNGYERTDVQTAWVQPVVPPKR